jgi:hypothetical protein
MISLTELYRYQAGARYDLMRSVVGLRGVYAKITQGINWVDPLYAIHRDGIVDVAGLDFGVLHFLDYANYTSGREAAFGAAQAEFCFTQYMQRPVANLPTVLDMETNDGVGSWPALSNNNIGRVLTIALAFCNRWQQLAGYFPWVYTHPWITDRMWNFLEGEWFLPRYQLLQAQHNFYQAGKLIKKGEYYQPEIDHFLGDRELEAYIPPTVETKYAKQVKIFQYASTLLARGVIGIPGYIDADVWLGTDDEYEVFAGHKSAPLASAEDGPAITRMQVVNCWLGLTIREGPSRSARKIGGLSNGTKIETIERVQEGANWWRHLKSGGYAAEQYGSAVYLKQV